MLMNILGSVFIQVQKHGNMIQLQCEYYPDPISLPTHCEPSGFPPNHIQQELLPLESLCCRSSQAVPKYCSREIYKASQGR